MHQSLPTNDVLSKTDGLVVIELCAGCAQLSSSFKKLGFQVLPFDNAHNRHATRVTVYQLDLTLPGAFQLLLSILDTENVVYLHFASIVARRAEQEIALFHCQ